MSDRKTVDDCDFYIGGRCTLDYNCGRTSCTFAGSDPAMDEFAAFVKMWIVFHEARPDVSLAWFVQHYRDGELVENESLVSE